MRKRRTNRQIIERYKYRVLILLRKLPVEDYDVAMKWLPKKLSIDEGTFRHWIYIKQGEKREIPARALILLAGFFRCHPKHIYTIPPKSENLPDEFQTFKTDQQMISLNAANQGYLAKWGAARNFPENWFTIEENRILVDRFQADKVIKEAGAGVLTTLGFGLWDEEYGLFLFPAHWWNIIPEGTLVTDRLFQPTVFSRESCRPDVSDHGLLSYGLIRSI